MTNDRRRVPTTNVERRTTSRRAGSTTDHAPYTARRPTGIVDGGIVDGGFVDGGFVDGGIVDGGIVDGGFVDGGIVDGGHEWPR